MLHETGIFTYMFHTFMMVGKYYMEHLAYMIDFGIFSICSLDFHGLLFTISSPEDSTGRPWSRDVQPIARHATQDRAGRYLWSKIIFSRILSSVMRFLDVGRWVIYLVDVLSKLVLIFLDEKQAKDVSFEFGRCICI